MSYIIYLQAIVYDSYSPPIHRPSMYIPGGIVNKTFLTALLEYFNSGDFSIRDVDLYYLHLKYTIYGSTV